MPKCCIDSTLNIGNIESFNIVKTILSFSVMHSSVSLHECSPILVGLFLTLNSDNCILFDKDMCILIGKGIKLCSLCYRNI